MPIYVALGRITEEGLKNLGGFAPRHQRAVERAVALGAEVLASYALLGRYDFLVILDCPDEKTVARVLVGEARRGNIRYETLTAVPIEDFTLVEAIPPVRE